MKKYDTVVFDLDGTLLNTLEDLHDSVNYALRGVGMPERSLEEIRSFVGNGVRRLVELAVPQGAENPKFEEVFAAFRQYYSVHCNDKTAPYPQIMELLQALQEKGYQLAIVSNKFQDAVEELKKLYFEQYVTVAMGQKDKVRKKPAPDMVFEALKALDSTVERAVYVGDSEVDIATAANAGMDCIVVAWGFRTREEQKRAGGRIFADSPLDILELI